MNSETGWSDQMSPRSEAYSPRIYYGPMMKEKNKTSGATNITSSTPRSDHSWFFGMSGANYGWIESQGRTDNERHYDQHLISEHRHLKSSGPFTTEITKGHGSIDHNQRSGGTEINRSQRYIGFVSDQRTSGPYNTKIESPHRYSDAYYAEASRRTKTKRKSKKQTSDHRSKVPLPDIVPHWREKVLSSEFKKDYFSKLRKDELDEIVEMWNAHRIRPYRNRNIPCGRPMVMYNLPHLYRRQAQICRVSNAQIELCENECSPKTCYPCDETMYELCCLLMMEENYDVPSSPEEALHLYHFLRNSVAFM